MRSLFDEGLCGKKDPRRGRWALAEFYLASGKPSEVS